MIDFSKKSVKLLFFLILALGLIFIWRQFDRTIEINDSSGENQSNQENISPLSGLACQNYQRRIIAVAMASDPVARPLAGLSQADLVIEMPVITNSITRILAFYLCQDPEEIGSLRSARHDFIPLAQGFDAILVHWGGSHFALNWLNAGVMENIDALTNPYNAFYRKTSQPAPHNGFTDMERLIEAAQKLNYRLENNFEGYSFTQDQSQGTSNKVLRIDYAHPYNVFYQYQSNTNSYLRYRDNWKEIDTNNGQQIEAKNIIVMRVFSEQIEGPYYNDLDLEGTGECHVYQNGIIIDCLWQKSEKNPLSKLKFLDSNNQEIPLVPGQTWIEMIEPEREVTWE